MKFAIEARLSQLFRLAIYGQTGFYAIIWTLYGHWGSGPSAPDGEIPNFNSVQLVMLHGDKGRFLVHILIFTPPLPSTKSV